MTYVHTMRTMHQDVKCICVRTFVDAVVMERVWPCDCADLWGRNVPRSRVRAYVVVCSSEHVFSGWAG